MLLMSWPVVVPHSLHEYLFRYSGSDGGTMVDIPGLSDGPDVTDDAATGGETLVSCTFQDGTLHVSDDRIRIERPDRSKFSTKDIEANDVRGVTYEKRLVISYLQIEQAGVENGEGGLLSTPVDENTLHFGRGKRNCAEQARDAIRDVAEL